MSKHTPGPWTAGHDGHGGMYILGHGGVQIGFVSSGQRQEANAQLITAAPELLDELKALRRAYVNLLESGRDRIVSLGGQCDDVTTMEVGDPHLRSSGVVIAKATGAAS